MPTVAIEAASGVATSSLVSFTAILSDSSTTQGGSAADLAGGAPAVAVAAASAVGLDALAASGLAFGDEGGAAARGACPRGGTVDATCRESGGSSTVDSSFSGCRMMEEATGHLVTMSGSMVATVAARGVCATGDVPSNVRLTAQFRNFTATTTDAHGNELSRLSLPDLTETIDPRGRGCAGANQTLSMDGSFSVVMAQLGVDVSGTARDLVFEVTSTGTPCVQHVTVNGGLDVVDHAHNRRFSESAHDLGVTLTLQPDGGILGTLDGELATDCLGAVTFETITPLHLSGSQCPSDGLLAVTRADGVSGRIRFTAGGGVEIDYDGDGTADKVVAECRDAALSQCQ